MSVEPVIKIPGMRIIGGTPSLKRENGDFFASVLILGGDKTKAQKKLEAFCKTRGYKMEGQPEATKDGYLKVRVTSRSLKIMDDNLDILESGLEEQPSEKSIR